MSRFIEVPAAAIRSRLGRRVSKSSGLFQFVRAVRHTNRIVRLIGRRDRAKRSTSDSTTVMCGTSSVFTARFSEALRRRRGRMRYACFGSVELCSTRSRYTSSRRAVRSRASGCVPTAATSSRTTCRCGAIPRSIASDGGPERTWRSRKKT